MFKLNALVSPMFDLGNDFSLRCKENIYDLKKDDEGIYERIEQGEYVYYILQEEQESGFIYTTGMMNSSPLVHSADGKGWITSGRCNGFGGHRFTIQVKDYGSVTLLGAWSGNSKGFNKVLEKPVVECSFAPYFASYACVEQLNLPEGFTIETNDQGWYKLRFEGKTKHQLSKTEMMILETRYRAGKLGVHTYDLPWKGEVEALLNGVKAKTTPKEILQDFLSDRGIEVPVNELTNIDVYTRLI